jgi:hypothetical protein
MNRKSYLIDAESIGIERKSLQHEETKQNIIGTSAA